MGTRAAGRRQGEPWNKGKLVGQKSPLKLKDIRAVRVRLQIADRVRDLALLDLAIDKRAARARCNAPVMTRFRS